MRMSEHLIELFRFNDTTNKQLFGKIGGLEEQTECIRLVSHLINCQHKWIARMVDPHRADDLDWWSPCTRLEDLRSNGIRVCSHGWI